MPLPAEKIWVPQSHQMRQVDPIQRALRAYDERLYFGRNEENGDWCVFLTMPRGENDIPVLGFQDQIPTPEACIERVRGADMRRYGDEILASINEENERLKQAMRDKAEDAEWQLAEAMESFLHGQNKTPYSRSYNKATESRRTGGN